MRDHNDKILHGVGFMIGEAALIGDDLNLLLSSALAPSNVVPRLCARCEESFCLDLYAESRRDEMLAWGWEAATYHRFIRQQFQARNVAVESLFPQARHWLLKVDKQAIGHLIVDDSSGEGIRLVDISLLPAWRDRGIGSSLINALKGAAFDRATALCLSVLISNQRATALYRRHGFIETGRDDVYLSMNWFVD